MAAAATSPSAASSSGGSGGNTAEGEMAAASAACACPICLDSFLDEAYLDTCFHSFCYKCICQWVKIVSTKHAEPLSSVQCPLCKVNSFSLVPIVIPKRNRTFCLSDTILTTFLLA
uniref:RING-finger protein n=1 Tax=Oryza sativa subsp. japonica TaxID=39947 RepID=Q6ATQ9_ORYSJ|nr:putative RING-finger protein [Oryza sativa Japonica Group]